MSDGHREDGIEAREELGLWAAALSRRPFSPSRSQHLRWGHEHHRDFPRFEYREQGYDEIGAVGCENRDRHEGGTVLPACPR